MYRVKSTHTFINVTSLSLLLISSLALNSVFAQDTKIPKDATVYPSGLVAKRAVKVAIHRTSPKPSDTVTIRYTGYSADGKQFDSSIKLGQSTLTLKLKLKHMIKGWSEGIQLMKVGEWWRFWIPPKLAYGNNPPKGTPNGMLMYDINLVSIKDNNKTVNKKTYKKQKPAKRPSEALLHRQLGFDYLRGKNGKAKNRKMAEEHFRRAVELGNDASKLSLSRLVSNNNERNKLLMEAVKSGNAWASLDIANYYQKGIHGYYKSTRRVDYWLKRAEKDAIASNNKSALKLIRGFMQKRNIEQKKLDDAAYKEEGRRIQQYNLREKQQKALAKAEKEYKAEQARIKKQQRRQADAQADAAAERDAQRWRDTVSGIKRMGDDITRTQRQNQYDTQRAYQHDKHTQRRNEKKAKAEYERKKQAIYAEQRRQQAALDKANALRDKKQKQKQTTKTKWDCKNNWRASKCGDRIVDTEVNILSPAYTGGSNIAGNTRSSGSQSGSTLANSNSKKKQGSHNSTTGNASGGKKQAMGKLLPEALAICKAKKSNPNLWWCDGPTQKLVLADDTLMKQLSFVGCGNANPQSHRVAAGKGRYVFFCQYGIQNYDRNIAKLYNLAGNILVKRRAYQCNKNKSSKCTTLASP